MTKQLLLLSCAAVAGLAHAGLAYDNTTSFSGFAAVAGGTTSVSGVLTTNMILDELTLDPTAAGQTLGVIKFTTANLNTSAVTARMRLRFFLQDGAGGAPGTALGGFSFAATSIASGVTLWTADVTANNFLLPSNKIWAGVFFDNSGAANTTAAQLDNMGQGLYNPPTVGSSADKDFVTSTPSSFLANNPAGTARNSPFSANPVANYGWQINTVPEPASIVALGLGLAAFTRRRRK